MDHEIARLMAEGQAAARRGDRAMARTLLSQLVEQDPHNEEAWMWLSGVVSDASEQQICLENALVINPNNQQARRGLEFLLSKTGATSRILSTSPEPSAPMPPETEPQAHVGAGASQPQEYDPAPAMPESWAVPGPEPADPFLATAPYPASVDPSAAGNGHLHASGDRGDLAATVPYTAPDPTPGDVMHAPAMEGEAGSAGAPGDMNGGNGMHLASDASEVAGSEAVVDDPGLDTPPFIPPGFVAHEGKLGHEDTATDLPAWLETLTPSAPAPEQHDAQFTPYGTSNMGTIPDFGPAAPSAPGVPAGQPDPNMPFGAPATLSAASAVPQMPQMSPFSELRLPSPHELPGDDGRAPVPAPQTQAQAQPWYLQGSSSTMAPPMPTGGISNYLDSTMLNSSMLGGSAVGAAVLDERQTKTAATVECPNCKQRVADTSLACPNCQYNFFVNCPHCHELVDTAGSVPGKSEPCPYCKQPINRMELGMGGVQDLVSQKNPGSRPAAAASMTMAFPEMKQDIPGLKAPRRGLRFDWVVDLLWLVAVVLMVWALTQLPVWLNLPGMY
jgi:hypothetical protein